MSHYHSLFFKTLNTCIKLVYQLVIIIPLHSLSPNKIELILSCFTLKKSNLRGVEVPFLLLFHALKFYKNDSELFLAL